MPKTIDLTMAEIEKAIVDTGLLYAINVAILHPVGLALVFEYGEDHSVPVRIGFVRTADGDRWSFAAAAAVAGRNKLRRFLETKSLIISSCLEVFEYDPTEDPKASKIPKVGWIGNLADELVGNLAEIFFARDIAEARYLAAKEWEIDYDDPSLSFRREPLLDPYADERVPAALERRLGLCDESAGPCESCGLGQIFDFEAEGMIGEICPTCRLCSDCGHDKECNQEQPDE